MKQDNFYHDHDIALEMVAIDSSDRVAKLTATLVEMSQKIKNVIFHSRLFITKKKVYFGQVLYTPTYLILCNYLALFVKVLSAKRAVQITQASPTLHQRCSDLCMRLLIRLFLPAISPNTALLLS